MMKVENDARVFFAKKGYYNGKEVTVTHRSGAEVWLEDYPVGKDPIEYGVWVPNDSVSYKDETSENNVAEKTATSKSAKKETKRRSKHRVSSTKNNN